MTDLREMREMDIMNPKAFYRFYLDYKYLYDFWFMNKNQHSVSAQEMRERIDYILKYKIRQRDEISTLCWVLGEEDVRERKT